MNMKDFSLKVRRRLGAYFFRAMRNTVPTDEKKVLFFTFQGKYTCNPKYICRALHEADPSVKCVWVALSENGRASFPDFVETVVFGTPAYYRALYGAKVWVDNGFNFVKQPLVKKPGQYYIETMHGSLGIKRIDASSNTNTGRNKIGFRCGELCDYIISNSDFETEVYRSSFWEKTPVLMLGHARNDILVEDGGQDRDLHAKVRDFYGLPRDIRLALYAPTFAREASAQLETFDAQRLRKALAERFGGQWAVLMRLHPRDARNRSVQGDGRYILDGNRYTDIQELMVAIDFAVTDYSSWVFDYVITGKPGMIFAPDLESYQNSTGFYYPITATPFPLATDNDSAAAAIEDFDTEKYRDEVGAFLKDKGCVDDGHASEKAAAVILGLLRDELPDETTQQHVQ